METEIEEKTRDLAKKNVIKVLLVEDDAIDRKLVERVLETCTQPVKFVIDSVRSLSEAAEHLKNDKHDIILLDLMLLDSDGLDTVRKIKEINSHVPIVVLTGLDDDQTGLAAIKIGAMDYLVKGQLSDKILIRTIQYAIEQKKKEKVMLDTNYQLQTTSKKLSDVKQELEKNNAALEKTQEVLEKRVEERTAELRKANDNLRSTEANLRTIIKQNADGIIIIDRKGLIRFVNDATESLFGRKKEKLVGESFGFAVVKGETTEIEVIRKRGEVVTAEMRVVEIIWEGEMVYLASLRNITVRKKAEEKLKETMKMKSEFISMVSHELRTPLTAIKEGIALVVDGLAGEINAEQEELLGISKKNVDRLARLINDVLDFQKIKFGKMMFNMKGNDVNTIVKDVYEIMASTAEDIGIDLLLKLNDNLPKVRFDSDKITQVLTNMVSNAMKFTEKGNITIKTDKRKGLIYVSVSDTGGGIKKKDLPRVFDRFEQLATGGERKTGGTGLGLAISKEIVEQHNGTIWVESKFGEGSKFTFTLPIHSTEKLFREYVDDGIKEALKNDTKMSLIFVSIADFDELKQELSRKKINTMLKKMEALLENSLRRGGNSPHRAVDAVFKLSSEIFVVLANCSKDNTSGVKEKLEQKLNDYLATQNLTDKIKLLYGGATYPDDTITSEELIKKAKELQTVLAEPPTHGFSVPNSENRHF